MTITFKNHTIDDLNNEYISFKKEDFLKTGYYAYRNRKEFKDKKSISNETILKKYKERLEKYAPPSYKDKIQVEEFQTLDDLMDYIDHSLLIFSVTELKKSALILRNVMMNGKYPLLKEHYHYLFSRFLPLLYKFQSGDLLLETIHVLLLMLAKCKHIVEFTINWKPLYEFYKKDSLSYGTSISFDDNFNQDIVYTSITKSFVSLISHAREFFNFDEAIEGINKDIQEFLIPQSNYLFYSINTIYLFFPTYQFYQKTEIPEWIDYYLRVVWNWIDRNIDWDERWMILFYRVIRCGYNIDWSPILPQLYTRMVRVVDMASPSLKNLKKSKQTMPSLFKHGDDDPIEFFHIGRTMVFLMNKPTERLALDSLKNFLCQIHLYFHPSNQEEWSGDLCLLVNAIAKAFLKRNKYFPFDQNIIDEFFEMFYPFLTSLLYSKVKTNVLIVCKIFRDFSYISPNFVLPKVLDKFYSSIGKEEVNRVISDMELMATCIHPVMTLLPEGKSIIFGFMEVLIKCFDPIYILKASAAFKLLNKIFSSIYICDETKYIGDCETQYDEAATSSTSSFSEWSVSFIDSVIAFMRKSQHTSKKDSSKRESPPLSFMYDTLELFFGALSNEIHDVVLKRLTDFFTKVYEPDNYKLFSEFLRASTLRDPVKTIKSLLPVFVKKLFVRHSNDDHHNNNNNNNLHTYQLLDLSDQEYKFHIGNISYLVFKGKSGLLEFREQLMSILTCLMESNNKMVIKKTSKIIRKLIVSLSTIYPSSYSFLSKEYMNKQENHIKYWGCSDTSKFFPIDWFEPNKDTIDFAKQLINRFLKGPNEKLSNIVKQLNNDNSYKFDRMEILNTIKPIQSIMRKCTNILKDDSPVIPIQRKPFSYSFKTLTVEHGQQHEHFKEFDSLKSQVFQNLKQLSHYLTREKNDEVQIFRAISKTMLLMFFVVPDSKLSGSDSLLFKWRNHLKFSSRNYYIFKAYSRHISSQRVHYNMRELTEMVLDACKETLNLSTHRYRKVRDVSQRAFVNIMIHYRESHKYILPIVLSRLEQLKSDEEIKGISYIIASKTIIKIIKLNSTYLSQLVNVLMKPLDDRFKISTHDALTHLKKDLLLTNIKPILTTYTNDQLESIKNGTYHCDLVPKESVLQSYEFNKNLEKTNRTNLLNLLNNLISMSKQHQKKATHNWKGHFSLLSALLHLFSILFYTPNDKIEYDKDFIMENQETIRQLFSVLVRETTYSDYPHSRIYSVYCLSTVLYRQGSKCFQPTLDGYNGGGSGEKSKIPHIDLKEMDEALEFENLIHEIVKDEIIKYFDNQSFLESFIKKLYQDHEGDKVLKKFVDSLVSKRQDIVWPNLRLTGFSKEFRSFNSATIYGLLSTIGIDFYDKLKPIILDLKTKIHQEEKSLLSELMGGLCRFISINDDLPQFKERSNEIKEFCQNILLSGFVNSINESTTSWEMSVRFAVNNIQYEKVGWIEKILFKNYKSPTSNILGITKSIRLLRHFYYEHPWKSKKLINRLIKISSKEFANSYKHIRNESIRLFSLIFYFETNFSVYPPIPPEILVSRVQNTIDNIESSTTSTSTPSNDSITSSVLSPLSSSSSSSSSSPSSSPATQAPAPSSTPATPKQSSSSSSSTTTTTNTETSLLKDDKKTSDKDAFFAFVICVALRSNSYIRLAPPLLRCTMELLADTNPDIAHDAGVILYKLTEIVCIDTKLIDEIIDQLNQLLKSPSLRTRLGIPPFIQIFFFTHKFYLTNQQTEALFNIVLASTRDPQIEIREQSKSSLSSMLITSKLNIKRIKDLIKDSIQRLKQPNQTTIEKHSAILVLCAIVLANPYEFPIYLPEVLEQLSRYAYNSNFKGASQVLADFWRTHSSTWQEDQLQFTESQIDDILCSRVGPSYFA